MGALPVTSVSNCCQRIEERSRSRLQQAEPLRAQEEARMLGGHGHRVVRRGSRLGAGGKHATAASRIGIAPFALISPIVS